MHDDLAGLAALSHALAAAAMAGAAGGARVTEVADDVMAAAGGRRDVVALALSYVLRAARERGEDLTTAIDAVALAVRRLST
ncbi:MAG TPA: hypothetical protein VHN98_09860 [Acidimicrobiales bacterium]|nr:hypothetical protein [Acidimicrobiales bacterium]